MTTTPSNLTPAQASHLHLQQRLRAEGWENEPSVAPLFLPYSQSMLYSFKGILEKEWRKTPPQKPLILLLVEHLSEFDKDQTLKKAAARDTLWLVQSLWPQSSPTARKQALSSTLETDSDTSLAWMLENASFSNETLVMGLLGVSRRRAESMAQRLLQYTPEPWRVVCRPSQDQPDPAELAFIDRQWAQYLATLCEEEAGRTTLPPTLGVRFPMTRSLLRTLRLEGCLDPVPSQNPRPRL